MNYATDYTIILTALYVLIIAIAFSPKCPQTVAPVDYFLVVEADLEPESAIASYFRAFRIGGMRFFLMQWVTNSGAIFE